MDLAPRYYGINLQSFNIANQGSWSRSILLHGAIYEVIYCTSGFFSSKARPSTFIKHVLPSSCGLKSHMHLGYCVEKHTATIICADRTK